MLSNISNNDNYNIKDSGNIAKTALNPYKTNKGADQNGLLIDETDISTDAMELYQKDADIQKFTALALSDFDSVDDDTQRVMDKLLNISSTFQDEDLADSLLNNDNFKSDLLG